VTKGFVPLLHVGRFTMTVNGYRATEDGGYPRSFGRENFVMALEA
jgi:hypothetical protein